MFHPFIFYFYFFFYNHQASSVRLIIGCKWPNFDLEPVSWRREDLSGKVLGRQHTVELLEVPSPNGVPCVIHACSFATPAEIEYLRRAVHFYKATANAGKADPILVTLAIDPEDALTALTQGIEVYLCSHPSHPFHFVVCLTLLRIVAAEGLIGTLRYSSPVVKCLA